MTPETKPSDIPRTTAALAARLRWKARAHAADIRGSHLDSDDPAPPDGWEFAESLERELASLRAENAKLTDVWKNGRRFVITEPFGCHGYKCREDLCWSCNGEDEAAEAAVKAKAFYAQIDAIINPKQATPLTTTKEETK